MALPALDHVQIAMPPGGEAAARAFYGGLLGLGEMPKPSALAGRGGLWFTLAGGIGLHLGVEDGFRAAAKAHAALRVAGFDALLARLAAASLEVAVDRESFGRRRTYIADPFGDRMELIEATAPREENAP